VVDGNARKVERLVEADAKTPQFVRVQEEDLLDKLFDGAHLKTAGVSVGA